jgi:broad specificity phosphatase PhoE
MIDMAANETNCSSLVAITHSSYLRILLGAVQDFALFSATTPQSNCGINVIDFPRPSTTTFSTNRFGGEGNTNAILIPKGEVIRVNERRHLSALRLSERQPSWNQITSSY